MSDLLLGIDLGTTGVKALLATAGGELVAQASREIKTSYPQPGWAEQSPDEWWAATCDVIGRALAAAPRGAGREAAQRVRAICISSQAPTLVIVDSAGRPVAPAHTWMDRRSEPECAWLRATGLEEQIVAENGGRVDSYFLAPKLLWVARNQPEWLQPGNRVLLANGYLVLKLTGVACVDRSHGPLTQLYAGARGDWSAELLAALELAPELLPPLLDCGAVAGSVTVAAAAATGLLPGTPVLAGMVDGTAAALEAGVLRPGHAVEMTGQSTVLLMCSGAPYRGRELFPLGHALADRHLVVGAMVATGGALRWFRDQLAGAEVAEAGRRGVEPFELLTAQAESSPAGANRLLFLPWLYGERSPIWDANARGVFLGLSLATTRADLIRAVLEGAAYGLRHNLATAAAAGVKVKSLVCLGGGARSRLWLQIKADVLQRPVWAPAAPNAAGGAVLGDAILAAVSAGLHRDLESAVAAMTAPMVRIDPNPDAAPIYDGLFDLYRSLYPALQPAFETLAALPAPPPPQPPAPPGEPA